MRDPLTITEASALLDITRQSLLDKIAKGNLIVTRIKDDARGTFEVDRASFLSYNQERLAYHTDKVKTIKAAIAAVGAK